MFTDFTVETTPDYILENAMVGMVKFTGTETTNEGRSARRLTNLSVCKGRVRDGAGGR